MRCLWLVLLVCFVGVAQGKAEDSVYAPQAPLAAPTLNNKDVQNFGELRNQLVELIASGRRRVWLMTDYLTDGDIVSALYLAKYRRVDVRVFLGRAKQNEYLSRLSYLRAQNIPVFVRPEHGFVTPTLLFVDQRLYTVNRDLNVLQSQGNVSITQASPADVKAFVGWFRDIIDHPEPTRFKPEMEAGRSNRSRPAVGGGDENKGRSSQPSYQGESDGSYNYDRSQNPRRAPEGVATKLPKTPRWKNIQEMRQNGESTSEGLPAVPSTPEPNQQTPLSSPVPQNVPAGVPDASNPATIEGDASSK